MSDKREVRTPTPRIRLYRQARNQWGYQAQIQKAIEEFSEAAAVLAREQNDQANQQDVLEELADARIMLEQLEQAYSDEWVDQVVSTKAEELEMRLQNND